MTPTTYGRDFAYCLKSHGGVRGFYASLWRFLLRCTLFCHSVATFLTSVSSYEGGCGFEDNKKYFNLKGCYDKFKEVYWTQHCRFKAGDTGYIYGSSPESAIRFKFEVEEADMPYEPFMDQDDEFVSGDSSKANATHQDNIYAHLILTGETTTRRLSLANLLERGLKSAPMGAMNLSKPEMKELLEYIEDNF